MTDVIEEAARIIDGHPIGDEDLQSRALRPPTLTDFVGQKGIKHRLEIAIGAARKRGEALDHVLLSGPPGLGKTSLALIIADAMGAEITLLNGAAIQKVADLLVPLTTLKARQILFIDEFHRIPKIVAEYLYPAMEDFRIDITIPGSNEPVVFNLQPFTLIGATTRAGMLTSPVVQRFGLQFEMEYYPADELGQIVKRSSDLLGVGLSDEGALEIARRSRGTPRIANRLLRRVRDFGEYYGSIGRMNVEDTDNGLRLEGIDQVGMDRLDRKYLTTLCDVYGGGPAGVAALAATMQQELDTIEDGVEPWLLREGYILRTPSGRCATAKAYDHIHPGRRG